MHTTLVKIRFITAAVGPEFCVIPQAWPESESMQWKTSSIQIHNTLAFIAGTHFKFCFHIFYIQQIRSTKILWLHIPIPSINNLLKSAIYSIMPAISPTSTSIQMRLITISFIVTLTSIHIIIVKSLVLVHVCCYWYNMVYAYSISSSLQILQYNKNVISRSTESVRSIRPTSLHHRLSADANLLHSK